MSSLHEYMSNRTLFDKVAPLVSVLDGVDVDDLDALLVLKFGERPMYDKFEVMGDGQVARLIALNFGDAWADYQELSNQPLAGRYEKTIDTFTGSQDMTGGENSTSKVSAYNSPELLDDSGNESEREVTTLLDNERTIIKEITGLNERLELHELASNTVANRVLFDVASFLTLDVY